MINTVYKQLANWCRSRGIRYDLVKESADIRAIFVPKEYKNKAQHISNYANKIAREYSFDSYHSQIKNGILVIMAESKLSENTINSISDDLRQIYDGFYGKLEEALTTKAAVKQVIGKSAVKTESVCVMEPPKKLNDKIDEAFKVEEATSMMAGIATPMNFQPDDGLKALKGALTAMGLIPQLKKMGIKWHVAKPGKHTITFSKNNVPILQKDTASMADKKELEDIINKLQSVALGQAPEAGKVEAERTKKREADSRAIADRFAGNVQPEQPIQ